MNCSALWKISVLTTPEAEEAVAEQLTEITRGTPASYFDAGAGTTTVSVFLEKNPRGGHLQKLLAGGLMRIRSCGLNIGAGKISLRKIRRENWAESWKRHFHPIEIGSALLIKPGWSKRRAKKNQAVVILDPGLSFGTGQHPTTGFCLQQIVACRELLGRQSFLDIGTGSGILAIAAAKLGYAPAEAFDFDPEAVRRARMNARKNRVAEKIKIGRADVTKLPRKSAEKFSLVCANLTANLLVAERERILSRLQPEGVLVLAGVLHSEFGSVQRHFEMGGLRRIATRIENEWQSGAFVFAKKI